MSLLDFLFPKFCINCRTFGSYLCSRCFSYITFSETGFCTRCQRAAIGGLTHPGCQTAYGIDGVFSSLVYQGVVKKLVYKFKYKPYLTNLQGLLIEFFYEGLIQKEQFFRLTQQNFVFVPIPLHASRFQQRGYNQSELLAKGLSKKFALPVKNCLMRIKKTKTQVGLSQKEREENIKDAFVLKQMKKKEIVDTYVFLVDDVATSGATLKEAAKVLKKAGVKKVFGLTLAHGL